MQQMGCRHCWDNPFATRPTARAIPGKGHYQNHIPAAPTFRPTAEEFADPFAYLAKIAPEAQKAGIAHIVPPEGWQPPIQLLDQQTGQLRKDFRVPVRIQPTHLLCKRHPTPSGAPPAVNPSVPRINPSNGKDETADGAAGDGDTAQLKPKKSNAVTARCSKAGMEKSHLPQQQPNQSNAVAGRCSKSSMDSQKAAAAAAAAMKDAIMNPAHWDAVATAAEATDGQFGYEHLEDPLSLYDFHRSVQSMISVVSGLSAQHGGYEQVQDWVVGTTPQSSVVMWASRQTGLDITCRTMALTFVCVSSLFTTMENSIELFELSMIRNTAGVYWAMSVVIAH